MTRISSAEAFGRELRALRRKKKMSQETLALEANLDRTYISLLELGRHAPSLDTMLQLCHALEISFADLARCLEERLKKENAQSGRGSAR
ncbi:helix-turn-helix domain-containing protein [Achromobacter xylosoxidans]|uniref:helix-turn-helix domain-containing protein n=1 Tax=Achromobacter TaxID=222 RepID=UPI0022771F6F|nr:helix-turn-helix transcriptional regulator [Achromobacter xylosoxidans]